MAKDMTDNQKRFCEEYLIDLNGKQAAIRAGYSEKTAEVQASRLLSNAKVKAHIKIKQAELSKKALVSAEWVLTRLKEISDRCMTAIPVMVREGKNLVQATNEDGEGVWQFDSGGANRSTELIAKHLGFFKEDNDQKGNIITVNVPK